jgi:N-acyl-D-aspartate/D-glutamate deacylase
MTQLGASGAQGLSVSAEFDLVIRSGTVVDGSGGPPFEADVAINDGRIAQVGNVSGGGREEVAARGRIVTPGFVDIHTHYDGQVTWEETLMPSSNHGVTTVVFGNCGVGFAPCRPQDRDVLVKLMEGVEDVPEVVMTEGLPWNWESFRDYLDALQQRRSDIDFAAQIPHSPLRVYVMGKRGADLEPPTEADLTQMTALVKDAVQAGALGVSTSRALNHQTREGKAAPSVGTEVRELLALAEGLKQAGRGVFQVVPNPVAPAESEFAVFRQIAAHSRRPLSFTLMETAFVPGGWRKYLDCLRQSLRQGLPIRGQVFPRPVGGVLGLDLSFHPFSLNPSYEPVRNLPHARKLAALRDPELRARLLAEEPFDPNPFNTMIARRLGDMYVLGDPPVYDPDRSLSIEAMARARGISARELAYDLLTAGDGHGLLYLPGANYEEFNLRNVREMITHPATVLGLGDGGAHYGIICDASYPTFALSRWVRDAAADEKLSLAWMVAALSRETALTVGLTDRGLIERGYKADLNVIDLDNLKLCAPRAAYDLPAKGRRLAQKAQGYDAMIVGGQIVYRHGEQTGARPGRLVRRH